MVGAHAVGNITEDLNNFVNERQRLLETVRHDSFKPSEVEKEKIGQYNDSSEPIEALFLRLKEGDSNIIKEFKKIILHVVKSEVQLSDEHILKFSRDISNYKIFRSRIRNLYHLHFLTHKYGNTSTENRFTDGIVIIEYSYCDQLLGRDEDLVKKHARIINPDILPIQAREFLQDLIRLPN